MIVLTYPATTFARLRRRRTRPDHEYREALKFWHHTRSLEEVFRLNEGLTWSDSAYQPSFRVLLISCSNEHLPSFCFLFVITGFGASSVVIRLRSTLCRSKSVDKGGRACLVDVVKRSTKSEGRIIRSARCAMTFRISHIAFQDSQFHADGSQLTLYGFFSDHARRLSVSE